MRSNAEHLRSTHTDVAARFTEYGGLHYTVDWGATFPPKHGQALVYYSAATISKTNYLTRSTQHLSVSPQSERYQTVHRKTTSSIIDCARRRRRSVVPLRTMSSPDDVSAAIHTGNAHNEAITRRSPTSGLKGAGEETRESCWTRSRYVMRTARRLLGGRASEPGPASRKTR